MSKTKTNIKVNNNLLFFLAAVIILLIMISYRLFAAQTDAVGDGTFENPDAYNKEITIAVPADLCANADSN